MWLASSRILQTPLMTSGNPCLTPFFCSFLLPFAFVFQHVYRAEKALFYCSTADYYEKVLSLSKLAMLLDKSLDLLG